MHEGVHIDLQHVHQGAQLTSTSRITKVEAITNGGHKLAVLFHAKTIHEI